MAKLQSYGTKTPMNSSGKLSDDTGTLKRSRVEWDMGIVLVNLESMLNEGLNFSAPFYLHVYGLIVRRHRIFHGWKWLGEHYYWLVVFPTSGSSPFKQV
jgi:hypothetical protein